MSVSTASVLSAQSARIDRVEAAVTALSGDVASLKVTLTAGMSVLDRIAARLDEMSVSSVPTTTTSAPSTTKSQEATVSVPSVSHPAETARRDGKGRFVRGWSQPAPVEAVVAEAVPTTPEVSVSTEVSEMTISEYRSAVATMLHKGYTTEVSKKGKKYLNLHKVWNARFVESQYGKQVGVARTALSLAAMARAKGVDIASK